MIKALEILNAITDKVLAYRPKAKTKKAKASRPKKIAVKKTAKL